MPENTTIFIGKKPVMNYVLACLTTIQSGTDVLIIKARGNAISKAVNVAQITLNRFVSDLSVKNITIGTEQIQTDDSTTPIDVSSIEIQLGKT
ncbi:MAG: DNA-binding protein Alba [Thaumarchaeota archaeon]|nr:DNA-binding protein Alba [Nitrososphaerota archaeon]MCZ6724900.1 DNA-binding protein Alba [Nitrososphaerota archaeon]